MRKSSILKFLGSAGIIILLAGCAAPSTSTTSTTPAQTSATTNTPQPSPSTSPQPITGPYGDLKVALSSLAEEKFDPAAATQTNVSMVLTPMFDFLFRTDGTKLAPGVIEKWEIAPDGLSWMYYVRKGIKFHNGDDLTANDVKFTLDRYVQDPLYPELRNAGAKAEVVDSYTVRVKTDGTQPFLPFVSTIFTPNLGLVQPKAYIEKNGIDYFQDHPVGSGSFKFVRHVSGDTVQYQALTQHWRQVPAFKNLSLILVPEETTRVAMLKTKIIDAIDSSIDSSSEIEAAGGTTYGMTAGVSNVLLFGAYAPQGASKAIADIRVRHALSLAINRDEIRQIFFHGKAGPPVPPGLTDIVVDMDIPAWKAYAAKIFNYDPAQAKSLLKDAGYPDGFDIKIYSYAMGGAAFQPKLAEVIQGYWRAVGVKASVVPIDYGIFKSMRTPGAGRTPAPDLVGQSSLHLNSPAPIYPRQLIPLYHSTGVNNLLSNKIPEVDALIDGSLGQMDAAKRAEMVDKVTRLVTESYTVLVIGTVPDMIALGPRVQINFPQPSSALSIYLDIAKHKGE